MWTDDVVRSAPAVKRALREVVERLKVVEGVEVIEWKALQQKEALEILVSCHDMWGDQILTGIKIDKTVCSGWWQGFCRASRVLRRTLQTTSCVDTSRYTRH